LAFWRLNLPKVSNTRQKKSREFGANLQALTLYEEYVNSGKITNSRFHRSPFFVRYSSTQAAKYSSSATKEQAKNYYNLPKECFLNHWNGDENPIILFDNAFDASSLGE